MTKVQKSFQPIQIRRWAVVLAGCLALSMLPAKAVPAAEAQRPARPIVASAAEIDYPPFSIVDPDGRATGFAVELMRAALAAMGREVTFRTGPWKEVRAWLERGEIDALPLVGRTPEREALFDFTVPYMSLQGAIVVRKGTEDIRDLEDLEGRQVAVMKGDNAEEFLRREDRGFTIVTKDTFEVALRELSGGRYDAVVTQRLVALRLIAAMGLGNLEIVNRPIEGFRQDFCFAAREGDRDTLALLNEGLAIIVADGTHRRLHAKWFAQLELPADRPIVVGGDHNYPPFEFLDDNGRPAGFTVELTRAIARELNMDVRIELGPWEERVNALRDGRIDALEGMFYSPERDRMLDFSPRYLVLHCVSVVRKGEGPPPATIEALQGRDLVVQAEDAILDALAERGIEARITTVKTQEDVVRAVAEGRNACGLGTRFGALYAIRKNGWTNIDVGDREFYSGDYAYAVPHGNEALLAKFTEGLQIIKDSGEYQRIYEKWLGLYEPGVSSRTVLKRIAIVAVPLLAIALLTLLWSWSLRRQVARKTRDLQESIDKFKFVFESANVGKSLTLPTGEINANQAFADLLGYTREELRSKTWRALTPAEDIEGTQNRIDALIRGDKDAIRFEKRYIHKRGTVIWADVSAAIRRDAAGRPLHFITTVVDITARKQAETALRESEAFQRAMIACSPVALYSIDLAGKVQDWNESAERVFGWSAEEVMGGPLPIVPDDKQAEFSSLHQEILSGRSFAGVEVVRRRKSGELFVGSLSAAPIRSPEGTIVGVMGAFEDITTRKRAERILRKSEKRFRLLVESAPDAIFIQTESHFAFANPACVDLLKAGSAEDLAGTPILDCFHPDDHEQIRIRIRHLNEKRRPVPSRVESMVALDGEVIPVEVAAVPYEHEGRQGALVFARDIRDRIKTEHDLAQSEQRFRRAVEEAPFPIMIHADDGEVLTISRAWEEITGYRREEIPTVADWISRAYGERSDAVRAIISETYAFQERKSEGAFDIICEDGSRRIWEFSSTPLGKLPDGRRVVISMAADITAHKKTEDRLRHLSNVLRAIRRVNQMIIQEKERQALLQRSCEIITETRGYRSAWIGLRDPDGNLHAVAEAGIGETFVMVRGALEQGDLPVCCRQALEHPGIAVVHNTETNCVVCPLSRNYRDTAALAGALRYAGREFGVLVVALPAEVADDPEEQALFKELAADIAFALQGIEVAQAREQVEAALAASEAQYRLLADNTLDVIWTMRPDLTFTYVNPAIERLTGYTPGEWIGTRLSEHCDERRLLEMAAIIEAEIPKGDEHRGVVFETEMRRRDGAPIPVEIHGKVIFDDDANPVMLQGVTRDISERRKAHADLIRSEHRLRSLVDAIPDLVWLKDGDGVYLFCNPPFERFFGARESEIVGKTDYDFVDREMADFFREHDRKAMAAGRPSVNEEVLTFAADGYRGLFETVKTPMVGITGDLIGVLGIARDISERKNAEKERLKLEDQLHQAQKMESVGRLAGGVAHDFNNILSVIIGYAELALDDLDPQEPLHADLKEIISAAQRSRDITRQLLAFARKETIAPEVLDLNETVGNLLKMLGRLIGEDLDLAWHPAPGLWSVKLDPSQVDQILANLCVNARDAIRDVGRVTIETGNVTIDAAYPEDHPGFLPGDFVMLAVSDDGCGMDRETVDKIFEPFFTTKGVGGGTGLGLATVFGIVKQNEGFINVYSEPGKGTTFKIYLPRHGGMPAAERRSLKEAAVAGHGETVLVVEDDPAILKLTARILASLNYRVLKARTPREAIDVAKSHGGDIQLLLTDVVMPDMNGRELSETLAKLYPGVKTLFMSGYTANVIAHRGVLDTGIHFLHKPFSKQRLAAKVREALDDEN